MENRKLKVGIMCQGPEIKLWQKQCIDHMIATGHVEIKLFIIDDAQNYPPRSLYQKISEVGIIKFLFNIYMRTIYRPASINSASISELFCKSPSISCIVKKKGKFSQYFSQEDLEKIRSYDLDIILRFGFNIIRGEILNVPKYGVWSFHHDDEMKYRGGPPCFWEIYHQDVETGSVLQRLTNKLDGGVILKKGIFRTKGYSYSKNIDQAYFESAKWPAWVCNDIINNTAQYIDDAVTTTDAPIYRSPTNFQFIRFLFIMWMNFIRNAWFRLFVMQKWNVALVKANVNEFLQQPSAFQKIFLKHKNKSTFNADCFGLKVDAKTHIFFEELDYSDQGVGELQVTTVDQDGKEGGRIKPEGISNGSHLSYPYLFTEGSAVYLVPESGARKKIILYKAIRFPGQWKEEAILLNGEKYSDATLLKHEGKYWLFFTVHNELFDADLHLHLAFSDQITGPYTLHAQNPVKISARSARPAGNVFRDDKGRLIRPAQNFCKSYGGSIVFNEIKNLTEALYEEVEINELHPFDPFYKDGVHTISVVSNDELLIDMKRHRLKAPFMT